MAVILVIDDEVEMRQVIARALQGAGHTVHEAADGCSGLELFRDVHPALVIADIVMPEMEGIETIRRLRRDGSGVPIVAISGNNPLYLHFATELGAAAALPKPFAVGELLTTVTALLAPVA